MTVPRTNDVWNWSSVAPHPSNPDRRVILELPAVGGTGAVRCDGALITEVAYSWLPQQFDLSSAAGREVNVQVEAAPKHKYAGFLDAIDHPAIGLWREPRWFECGPCILTAPPRLSWQDEKCLINLECNRPIPAHAELRVLINGNAVEALRVQDFQWQLNVSAPPQWSPQQPNIVRVRVELCIDGEVSDCAVVPYAQSQCRADGRRLLLNEQPFQVRGLLHWGYYPELAGPDPSEQQLRQELLQMKARGFNLLKACLWLPNDRFLSICDEVGMAVWIEYPLWDQPLEGGDATQAELHQYRQWVQHDAVHPCVVLRTLTCENDRRDADAARKICKMIGEQAPDGLVNDNSAWLGCNHHVEFWDEHPYLHAAQWPFYLQRLKQALDLHEQGTDGAAQPKPLLLGETMAFDSLEACESRLTAVELRREQATSLLQTFPAAGYVICAARDIPQSPLGLQDQHGVWKTDEAAWQWQRDLELSSVGSAESPAANRPTSTDAHSGAVEIDIRHQLDAATLTELRNGAVIVHQAGPRPRSWRTPEHTFFSPVASWDACVESVGIDLFQSFLSGRGLTPPPPEQARILAAAHDVHDLQGDAKVQPFLFAARVGAGSLLVSALRNDCAAHTQLLADLSAQLRQPNSPLLEGLAELQIPEPPRTLFLDGPWQLRGGCIAESGQTMVGTMLVNDGSNAAQGWVDAEADFTLPADWTGAAILRAEGVGDGFELYLDGEQVAAHGRLGFTWDAGRDVPANIDLSDHLQPGRSTKWRIRTKDHRGGGVLVGPIYLCNDDPEASLLY